MTLKVRLIASYLLIFCLVAMVSVFLIRHINANDQRLNFIKEENDELKKAMHLNLLSQHIKYYDEVLTQSARNYAFTRDAKWKNRYEAIEPRLDETIKEAVDKGNHKDKQSFSQVDEANSALVNMEHQAMRLVDAGQSAQAIALLGSGSYWNQKKLYDDALKEYIRRQGLLYDQATREAALVYQDTIEKIHRSAQEGKQKIFLSIVIIALVFIFLIVFNISYIFRPVDYLVGVMGNFRSGHLDVSIDPKIKKSKGEIGLLARVFDQMGRELKNSYEHLEQKVKSRTQELNKKVKEMEDKNEELQSTKKAVLNILEDLEESKKSIEKQRDDLAVLKNELEHSNKELEQFAYIASHDLQEPLRKIVAFGDLLHEGIDQKLNSEQRNYLKRMQNAAYRMKHLIEGLLDYSRITTKIKPFEKVDLNQKVQEALSNLEIRIKETGAQIDIGELPAIMADELQMAQLFQNLIGNAIKFHKKGQRPEVKIRSTFQDGIHKITIEDNGIGFDKKYMDRVFAPFQKLHARDEYEGTGIGLSICQKIVKCHNGTMKVQSSPDNGATFIIYLPIVQTERSL